MIKMLKRMKFIGIFLVAVAMYLPGICIWASAETYTVTFRPGDVGYFAMSPEEDGDKQAMAEDVADRLYSSYDYEVTSNGAIKITVPANATVPQSPAYIQAEEGYFVKEVSVWGPKDGQTVDRNMDFVVDYGRLVNGVEYTVRYVDSVSGESVAPIYIAQASQGELQKVTAPKKLTISGGTVYNLVSEETAEKVMDIDPTNNVFTFSYMMASGGTRTEEIVEYVEGDVITVTETIVTRADKRKTTVISQEQKESEAAEEIETENHIVEEECIVIAEENAANEEETVYLEPSDLELADEETALAASKGEAAISPVTIVAVIFVIAAVAMVIIRFLIKKGRNEKIAE